MMDAQTQSELQTVLSCGVMFWGIARVIHWVLSRSNESKRVHGLFIPEWVGVVYTASGLVALWWSGPAPNTPAPPSQIFASYGLLVGLAIGWVHGSIRLSRCQVRLGDTEEVSPQETVDDGNPYQPPRHML
ncbi:MAG: hypothetical protein MUC43_09735 [Pirellula sp.]|jgi:hypothetical protein|nr:hypothetical protein [Pirellula sp.]